ncbi:MAG: hypothetical protein Q9228_007074 [Teloschistes exilis]
MTWSRIGWYLPNLRQLSLGFVLGSFMQFVQLLLLNLPEPEMLIMHNARLEDGRWNEIVEGLANLGTIRRCTLSGLMFPSQGGMSGTFGEQYALAMSQYVVNPQRHSIVPVSDLARASKDQALRKLGPMMEQRQELLSHLAALEKKKKGGIIVRELMYFKKSSPDPFHSQPATKQSHPPPQHAQ